MSRLASVWLTPALVQGCGSAATFRAVTAPPHPMTPKAVEAVDVYRDGPPDRP